MGEVDAAKVRDVLAEHLPIYRALMESYAEEIHALRDKRARRGIMRAKWMEAKHVVEALENLDWHLRERS
jgi:CRP-like cAMP-binding protein